MRYKIVSDSSSNILSLEDDHFSSVPMKVRVDREYVDEQSLDVAGLVETLRNFKGKSGSSCPNVGEWLEAFGDADMVFGVTITKYLSGSYNAAKQAADAYMEENPGKKAFIFDSLTAGPEMMLLVDKIRECAQAGMDFEAIKETVLDYHNHTHTLFCLESMMNLARNGRVSLAVAKLAGMLGIRVCGEAQGGQIVQVHKPRGAKKATETLVDMIQARGFFDGAKLRIAHCFAEEQANALAMGVLARFPNAKVHIEPTTALCSFYAEEGGLMIGIEGAFCEENDNRKF